MIALDDVCIRQRACAVHDLVNILLTNDGLVHDQHQLYKDYFLVKKCTGITATAHCFFIIFLLISFIKLGHFDEIYFAADWLLLMAWMAKSIETTLLALSSRGNNKSSRPDLPDDPDPMALTLTPHVRLYLCRLAAAFFVFFFFVRCLFFMYTCASVMFLS